MSKFTDQQYLKTDQYRDSSNLNARVAIHQRFVRDVIIVRPNGPNLIAHDNSFGNAEATSL